MRGPLLSIVTVCLNDADRLSKTIQSLSAVYGDDRYEHIVVDGGSTDHTACVVAPFMKFSNFNFESGRDVGIYDAMNRGIDCGAGQYFLFLNCGDCMLEGRGELADCLSSIEGGIGVDIVCFSFRQIGNDGKVRDIFPKVIGLHKLPTSHQGMIFSSVFIAKNRYDIRYKIAADYDLYLRANPNRIKVAPTLRQLSVVEVDGVASGNPLVSYREYLISAARNLHGSKRFITLVRIALKAVLIVSLKAILPNRLVVHLRGV